jgi:hypothetical protein
VGTVLIAGRVLSNVGGETGTGEPGNQREGVEMSLRKTANVVPTVAIQKQN